MKVYEIPGNPISWKRCGEYGKKHYDKQKKKKEVFQWHILSLEKGLLPACNAIKLTVEYHMAIPKSYSQKRANECLLRPYIHTPDLSNLIKFTEDALNGIVWKDDSIICEIQACKYYSETPKTVFKIEDVQRKVFDKRSDKTLLQV